MQVCADLELPAGVMIHTLKKHVDQRGYVAEIYRQSWLGSKQFPPIQWNFAKSHAGMLRGVHLHPIHSDYLILLEGKMLLGLHDVRVGSPTENRSYLLELSASDPKLVYLSPGIFHGFYFPEDSFHMYGLDFYWSKEQPDTFACLWNDPDLNIPWPINRVILSEQDENALPLKTLMHNMQPCQYKE